MREFKKIKAVLAAFITGAVAFGVQIPSASAESFVLENVDILTLFGDVNFDGAVSLSDAVQLNQYLLGNSDELGNWKNADIAEDGTIDVFDLIYLRRQLLGEKPPEGGTLNIDVADMMTGEFLEGADIEISGVIGLSSFPLGEFHYNPGETITIHGLPTSDKYHYVIDIKNLPENYGNRFGNWDRTRRVSFDGDSETKDLTLRFLDDDSQFNVTGGCFDWTRGDADIQYANITITDKDGNIYYQNIYSNCFALPDGEYHADLGETRYLVAPLDIESDFVKGLAEIYPDVEFTDKSDGIDFTVKDGKADKEVYFDFGPKDGVGNTIEIICIDAETDELVEGCELSLIESPDSYAKVIDNIVTDESAPSRITGLTRSGENAYKVVVDKLPEGYTSMSEYTVSTDYVCGRYDVVCFCLFSGDVKDEITANICALSGGEIVNDVGIINITDVVTGNVTVVKAGEPFVLPDGAYSAEVELNEDAKDDYVAFQTEFSYAEDGSIDSIVTRGCGTLLFKVQNGCPDQPIKLYVFKAEEMTDFLSD